MTTRTAIVEDELRKSQQAEASAVKSFMMTGTKGVTTSIYEFSEVDVDKYIDGE